MSEDSGEVFHLLVPRGSEGCSTVMVRSEAERLAAEEVSSTFAVALMLIWLLHMFDVNLTIAVIKLCNKYNLLDVNKTQADLEL